MESDEGVFVHWVWRYDKGEPQEVFWKYLDLHVVVREVNFGHKYRSFPRVVVNNGADQAQ